MKELYWKINFFLGRKKTIIDGKVECLKSKFFKVNPLPNCLICKDQFWKAFLILKKKNALDKSSVYQGLKGVHCKMLSTTIKAKFPWFYRYLLRQLKELESAWEEHLAWRQTLNQNQCPEYQSKACLRAACLKCFLFFILNTFFFPRKIFW